MAKWKIIKRYGHELGLSAVFRQFRAPETHCSKIHGYPLAFEVCFEGDTLDERNWLISFGELKPFKKWLEETFDHKTVVSVNDPALSWYIDGERQGFCQLTYVPEVGAEMFAQLAYRELENLLGDKIGSRNRGNVRIKYVMCSEHNGNSAVYEPSDTDLAVEEMDREVEQRSIAEHLDSDPEYITTTIDSQEDEPFVNFEDLVYSDSFIVNHRLLFGSNNFLGRGDN